MVTRCLCTTTACLPWKASKVEHDVPAVVGRNEALQEQKATQKTSLEWEWDGGSTVTRCKGVVRCKMCVTGHKNMKIRIKRTRKRHKRCVYEQILEQMPLGCFRARNLRVFGDSFCRQTETVLGIAFFLQYKQKTDLPWGTLNSRETQNCHDKKSLIFFFSFPISSGKYGKESLRVREGKTFFFGISVFLYQNRNPDAHLGLGRQFYDSLKIYGVSRTFWLDS